MDQKLLLGGGGWWKLGGLKFFSRCQKGPEKNLSLRGAWNLLFFFFFFFLKVDMPILTCIFFTFNWLTLTSEMHFVKFHPVVASCLLSRGKRKYAPLGMWKYIRNYFLVYQLISPVLVYLQNYKELEAEIFGFAIRKIWAFIWYQKIYYFRLSPGGWECDRHKGL